MNDDIEIEQPLIQERQDFLKETDVAKSIARQAIFPGILQSYDAGAQLLKAYFLSQASQRDFLASGLMFSTFDWAMTTEYPLSAARGIFAKHIAENGDAPDNQLIGDLALGKNTQLNDMAQQNRLLGLTIGLVPAIVIFFFTKEILISLGVRDDLANTVSNFTEVAAFAIPFMLLRSAEYNFLYAANRSKLLAAAMFTETTAGIALSAWLVPAHGKSKGMGARGAGIVVLAQSLLTNILLATASFMDKELQYYSILGMPANLRSFQTFKKIFLVGFPILFTSGMANISEIIRNILIGSMSNSEIAISQSYMSYSYIITSAGYVFAIVGGVHVAKFFGLQEFKTMRRTAYTSTLLNISIVLPFIPITYFIGPQLTSLFVESKIVHDHEQLIRTLFPIVFTANTIYGAQNSMNESLKNVQDTGLSAIITIFNYLVFGLFLAYKSIHQFHFGLVGLEGSYCLAFLMNAILLTLYWEQVSSPKAGSTLKTSNESCFSCISTIFSVTKRATDEESTEEEIPETTLTISQN